MKSFSLIASCLLSFAASPAMAVLCFPLDQPTRTLGPIQLGDEVVKVCVTSTDGFLGNHQTDVIWYVELFDRENYRLAAFSQERDGKNNVDNVLTGRCGPEYCKVLKKMVKGDFFVANGRPYEQLSARYTPLTVSISTSGNRRSAQLTVQKE